MGRSSASILSFFCWSVSGWLLSASGWSFFLRWGFLMPLDSMNLALRVSATWFMSWPALLESMPWSRCTAGSSTSKE
jgi:hypothetical protein